MSGVEQVVVVNTADGEWTFPDDAEWCVIDSSGALIVRQFVTGEGWNTLATFADDYWLSATKRVEQESPESACEPAAEPRHLTVGDVSHGARFIAQGYEDAGVMTKTDEWDVNADGFWLCVAQDGLLFRFTDDHQIELAKGPAA